MGGQQSSDLSHSFNPVGLAQVAKRLSSRCTSTFISLMFFRTKKLVYGWPAHDWAVHGLASFSWSGIYAPFIWLLPYKKKKKMLCSLLFLPIFNLLTCVSCLCCCFLVISVFFSTVTNLWQDNLLCVPATDAWRHD